MQVYDDKTSTAITSGTHLLVPLVQSYEDVTFKASYIVSSALSCKGKITALFDLIVFGDVSADEIDVKGRFICMGHCNTSGAIVVQNDMWCEDVRAASITCHDRIVAQSIDANILFADGSIIIDGQILQESYGKEIIMDSGTACDPITLGKDEYFVLGDNRNDSRDSRWPDVGNIHKSKIVGKAVFRLSPFSKFGRVK